MRAIGITAHHLADTSGNDLVNIFRTAFHSGLTDRFRQIGRFAAAKEAFDAWVGRDADEDHGEMIHEGDIGSAVPADGEAHAVCA